MIRAIAIALLLSVGCVEVDDEEPGVCVAGLIEAEDASAASWAEIKTSCESVGSDEDCAVVCNLRGYGLVCDAGGCERHERY